MYVVIFKATVAELDVEYYQLAERMKKLAFEHYDCQDFVSVTEGNQEIAISYWKTLQHIKDWKNDPEHRQAQAKGHKKWYKSFSVEICKLVSSR